MTQALTVYKHRTTTVILSLGYDVSGDTLTAEIHEGPSHTTPLIATWDVTFKNDGSDGQVILRLDDSVTSIDPVVNATMGYTDVKRVTAGEPVPVFDYPLVVNFREVVTE